MTPEQGDTPIEQEGDEPITWDHEMPEYRMTGDDVDAFAREWDHA